MNPRVSVIIPTKNRPELLKRAIASVLAQTFRDFEAIIVDDGDGSASAIAESFHDPRTRYVRNEGARGGGAARNRGAREAQGEYLAFLDDDDEWMPQKLAAQLSALERASPRAAFCFSSVRNVYGNREEVTQVPPGEAEFIERALTRFSGFLTSTLVIKTEAFTGVGGFDESLPSHQEPDLIIRLSRGRTGVGIDEPLVRMNMAGDYEHIGGSLARRIAGRSAILEKHHDLFRRRPTLLARHYFRIGLWNRDAGSKTAARKYFHLALKTSFSVRALAHYLLTFV